jgi:hypothetical protein
MSGRFSFLPRRVFILRTDYRCTRRSPASRLAYAPGLYAPGLAYAIPIRVCRRGNKGRPRRVLPFVGSKKGSAQKGEG